MYSRKEKPINESSQPKAEGIELKLILWNEKPSSSKENIQDRNWLSIAMI